MSIYKIICTFKGLRDNTENKFECLMNGQPLNSNYSTPYYYIYSFILI